MKAGLAGTRGIAVEEAFRGTAQKASDDVVALARSAIAPRGAEGEAVRARLDHRSARAPPG
jgi:hypothetical protein